MAHPPVPELVDRHIWKTYSDTVVSYGGTVHLAVDASFVDGKSASMKNGFLSGRRGQGMAQSTTTPRRDRQPDALGARQARQAGGRRDDDRSPVQLSETVGYLCGAPGGEPGVATA